jgi:arylesterase/paraoxonase
MNKRSLYLLTTTSLLTISVLFVLTNAGVFKTIEPLNIDMCTTVKGVVGAEDISFIPSSKTNQSLAFVSSYDRRIEVADPTQKIPGAIYLYDLDTKLFTKVSPDIDDFKPHGISIYQGTKGEIKLFVVDHAYQQQQIQIFSYINNKLVLERTVASDLIISPNDLVAVGPEQFYVSNDHGFTTGIMRFLEDYLMLPFSNIVYFDGENTKQVDSWITYANGININKAGDQLYVASVSGLTLYVYDRDLESNELHLTHKIDTGTGIDNIELDENGDLWIGAHPQLLKFVSHAKNIDKHSPSEIIKINVADGSFDQEIIYRNSGVPLSGSSVAAVKGNRMLVGSVFDSAILDCTL